MDDDTQEFEVEDLEVFEAEDEIPEGEENTPDVGELPELDDDVDDDVPADVSGENPPQEEDSSGTDDGSGEPYTEEGD